MAEDYYQSLGVERTATADEIQKAYRKLARKYHPDMNPDDKAAKKKFQEIQKAYDTLSDAEKRKKYDQFGPDFENANQWAGAGRSGAPFSVDIDQIFGGKGGPGDGFKFEGDIGDLFRHFGGGGGGGGGRARPGRGRAQPTTGNDVTAELTVPFNTAVVGGGASLSIERNGKRDTIQVTIPAGVDDGQKIRLRGQGEPAPGGGKNGDLILTLHVANHPHFRRVGKNLELRLPVTLGEAALGGKVDVPTPDGTVELKIPAGSGSGQRLRVRGQGVRDPKGSPGDLFVELQIKLPNHLDKSTQEAIETIERQYSESPRAGITW